MIYEYISAYPIRTENFILARTGDLLQINDMQLINTITDVSYVIKDIEQLQRILKHCREISKEAYQKRLENIKQVIKTYDK